VSIPTEFLSQDIKSDIFYKIRLDDFGFVGSKISSQI